MTYASCYSHLQRTLHSYIQVFRGEVMSLKHSALLLCCCMFSSLLAAQNPAGTAAETLRGHLNSIDRRVLEMAKDFPEAKYDFRLRPEMRSFAEVLVHIASGNVYAAQIARGKLVKWDELDPKAYK